MLKGADQRLRIERLLARQRSRPSRYRDGGVGEVFYKIFDYEVFTLHGLASAIGRIA
jgi:hypothetical protein